MRFYPFVFTGEEHDEETSYGYCNDYQPHAVKRMFDYKNGMLYDMRWDEAGNLGQVSQDDRYGGFEHGRFLFWTEDCCGPRPCGANRMHAAIDEKYYSYYTYDHTGERTLKFVGSNNEMDVNAEFQHTAAMLDSPTLYPSSYVVMGLHGYTKHYYAGAERICAKIGEGFGAHFSESRPDLQETADKLFGQSRDDIHCRELPQNDVDCIVSYGHVSDEELNARLFEMPDRLYADVEIDLEWFHHVVELCEHESGDEEKAFFYHSDHLGSASWITDVNGKPVQHLQYLPFGEPYVNQHPAGYQERFTFTGKERDEETGYGYFGARYMDYSLMTMWLSVDPMMDKYPSISPYAYCAWNPVKLVDPDGQFPILPFIWAVKATARGVEHFSHNSDIKTCAYAVNHPYNAIRTGRAIDGGKNGISSFAHNFSIGMCNAADLGKGNEGSQRNAIRHTLWQAMLTNELGPAHAERIGNNHENGTRADLSQRTFRNMKEADMVCDQLNNEIGRSIGERNGGATNVTMAEKVATEFYNNGLWTTTENSDGSISISKTKINNTEYKKVINELKNLNNYGLHE